MDPLTTLVIASAAFVGTLIFLFATFAHGTIGAGPGRWL